MNQYVDPKVADTITKMAGEFLESSTPVGGVGAGGSSGDAAGGFGLAYGSDSRGIFSLTAATAAGDARDGRRGDARTSWDRHEDELKDQNNEFTKDIMMMLDTTKVLALQKEFTKHEDGLSLNAFVHVMKRFMRRAGRGGGGGGGGGGEGFGGDGFGGDDEYEDEEEGSAFGGSARRMHNMPEDELVADLCEVGRVGSCGDDEYGHGYRAPHLHLLRLHPPILSLPTAGDSHAHTRAHTHTHTHTHTHI